MKLPSSKRAASRNWKNVAPANCGSRPCGRGSWPSKWRDLSRSQSRARSQQSRRVRRGEPFDPQGRNLHRSPRELRGPAGQGCPRGGCQDHARQAEEVRAQGHRASRAETRKLLRKEKIAQNRQGAAPAAASVPKAAKVAPAASAPARAPKNRLQPPSRQQLRLRPSVRPLPSER